MSTEDGADEADEKDDQLSKKLRRRRKQGACTATPPPGSPRPPPRGGCSGGVALGAGPPHSPRDPPAPPARPPPTAGPGQRAPQAPQAVAPSEGRAAMGASPWRRRGVAGDGAGAGLQRGGRGSEDGSAPPSPDPDGLQTPSAMMPPAEPSGRGPGGPLGADERGSGKGSLQGRTPRVLLDDTGFYRESLWVTLEEQNA